MVLVCTMLAGLFAPAVSAAGTEAASDSQVYGWNLTLADEIAVNFWVDISDEISANAVMQVTDGYGKTVYPISEAEKNEAGKYLFTANLAAAQLADEIKLELQLNGVTLGEQTYCALDYAKFILNGQYHNATKALMRSMLHYGAAAQTYFGYNTDNLANAGIEAAEDIAVPQWDEGAIVSGEIPGIRFYGASLVFDSRVAVRFYFDAESVEGISFGDYEVTEKNGKYCVEIPGINPQNYDDTISLQLSDGENEMTVSYSPMTYIARQYAKSSNEALRALVQSMYAYHLAAEGYLDAAGSSNISGSVTTDGNGIVTDEVILQDSLSTAVIAAGTQLEENTDVVTLSVVPMEATGSDVEVGENEQLVSMDVHVEGVAAGNTVPVLVTLNELAPEFLNKGNIALYHVEDGVTVEMTRVYSASELDAHNEYYYDIATGTVTVALASFSEVTVVADNENAWNGDRDYDWYDATSNELVIFNADQLAGFSAIVGGMDGQTQDSFSGKTVTLMADIDLGDAEANNDPDKIFYPIGYNSSDGKYDKTGVAVSTGFYRFKGTFDGNGHTIANFYHNTWEMKGDHNWYDATLQYYRDGMGLFGIVDGGTVKNLTVKNFSSDGEIATTGVIAAYADCGATFENITLFNCNPRVYNIGNGGIVGCVGWYNKTASTEENPVAPVTFRNITVDNSNKISALWGSYDVACGGIVGQYYPTSGQSSANYPVNTGIRMENCHVAAVMDVYNDVCANYQYYAYRYAGILIGSVRENETIDGRVYPKMDGITAEGCTVHYGDWNDYYYCELVDNTTASYTHDHQMSRLEQVASVDVENMKVTSLKGEIVDIPTSGRANYVVVNKTKDDGSFDHATENATCYHFKNGDVWNHEDGGTETVNGVEGVLKEDKQHIYLEFNNLVTGYGWGVTSKGVEDMDGVTILDREEGSSVVKFEKADTAKDSYTTGTTVSIGELFGATEAGLAEKTAIDADNVWVSVSYVGEDSTATGTYVADTSTWTNGTLTFSGLGAATITITDYNYCTPTTIQVTVNPIDAFKLKFEETDKFLYRVGNLNNITLSSLFGLNDDIVADQLGTLSIAVDNAEGYYTYTPGSTWDAGILRFAEGFTGPVAVRIKGTNTLEKTLNLEVVTAKNIASTTMESAKTNSVVLLNDVSGGFTVSGGYTVYGNDFTITLPTTVQSGYSAGFVGYVTMSGGNLDNVRIEGPDYSVANVFREQAKDSTDETKANYFYNSILINSGNCTISNSYISGSRAAICIRGGVDVIIENTMISGGSVANIHLAGANSLTLRDVITQQPDEVESRGMGIYVDSGTTKIIIEGNLVQHNWINEEEWDAIIPAQYQSSFPDFFNSSNYEQFQHDRGGVTYVNLGFIFGCNWDSSTLDNSKQTNKSSYGIKDKISLAGKTGGVYTTANLETVTDEMYNSEEFTLYAYNPIAPVLNFVIAEDPDDENDEADSYCQYLKDSNILNLGITTDSTTIDLSNVNIIKDGTILTHTAYLNSTQINGNTVTIDIANGTTQYFVFKAQSENAGYDVNGNVIEGSIDYTWTVIVNLAKLGYAKPEWTMSGVSIGTYQINANGNCIWVEYGSSLDKNYAEAVSIFKGITAKYYDASGEHSVDFSNITNTTNLTADSDITNAMVYTDPTAGYKLEIKYSAGWKGNPPKYYTNAYSNVVYVYPQDLTNDSYMCDNKQEFNVSFTYKFVDPSGQATDTITVQWYDATTYTNITTVQWKTFDSTHGKANSSICVTPDTLVTLADGTQKRIDAVTYEDQLLVWDFYAGEYTVMPSSHLVNHGYEKNKVIQLNFEDGAVIKAVNAHGFFDADLNEFVTIDDENVVNYVGHHFVKQDGTTTVLESYSVKEEYIEAYSILSVKHYNCYLGGMLSLTPPEATGNYFMPFEVGENMTFDAEKMQADIEKYGLFTYEEFADRVSEEVFYALNAPQVKVAIGKGIITMEEFEAIVNALAEKDFGN